MQAWHGTLDGAWAKWNSEFDQHPDRVRNTDKWPQVVGAAINAIGLNDEREGLPSSPFASSFIRWMAWLAV